jgi:hypothetical protein
MADSRSNVATPGLARLGKDAERVAQLYPVPGTAVRPRSQVGSLDIPRDLHELTAGLAGYGN